MLRETKKTIEHVLEYYKPTKVTNIFQMVYWISVLTPMVFFCIYYPYMVCNLLYVVLYLSVVIRIICTCGICCLFCCLYSILNVSMDILLKQLKCCMNEDKYSSVKEHTKFIVYTLFITYGLTVGTIALVFIVTGGVENTDFCIHSNCKARLALIALQAGPIVTAIGALYEFCQRVKSVQGDGMELKDEHNIVKEYDL